MVSSRIYRQFKGIYRQFKGVYRQFKGIYRQFKGIYRQFKGIYRQFKGVYRQFKGIYRQFKGIYRQFKGIYRQFKGIYRQFKGIYRQFKGIYRQFKGIYRQLIMMIIIIEICKPCQYCKIYKIERFEKEWRTKGLPQNYFRPRPLNSQKIAILEDTPCKILHPILVFRNSTHRLKKTDNVTRWQKSRRIDYLNVQNVAAPVSAVFKICHLSQIFHNLCLISLQINKFPTSINDSSLFMRNFLKHCFLERKKRGRGAIAPSPPSSCFTVPAFGHRPKCRKLL